MKGMKILTAFAVGAAALCGGMFGVTQSYSAYAADTAAVRIDFTDNTLYTATGTVAAEEGGVMLSASSSVATKEKFTNFLLYTEVTAEGGTIEVGFGANHTLKFKPDDAIETTLEKTGSERQFDFADFKDGGIVSLEVIGNTVTVGVSARVAPEEFLYQPVAVYSAENASGEIRLSVTGGTAKVSYMNVYSLAGEIEIEPDDYDENDGKFPVKPAPAGKEEKPEESGIEAWAIALIVVGCAAVVAGAAVGTALILRSKKRGKEEKRDEE